MVYSVRHITTFRYEPAVRESVMEIRMQPRSDGHQRCLSFNLETEPATNIMWYRDASGNIVHHFDIAGSHTQVKVSAVALVELGPSPDPRPEDAGDWKELDDLISSEDHWEFLLPSQFAHPTEQLEKLAGELRLEREGNPLELLTCITQAIYEAFAYVPSSTKVDSPIDDALRTRQGVCQDFAHIMIAMVRQLRVPCRYMSGYLVHDTGHKDRSPDGASHAWVEALLPRLGWVSFDPTNNLVGSRRHVRVAVGRDYADVPPNRGVYKGDAASELSVRVTVTPANAPKPEELSPSFVVRNRPVRSGPNPRSQQDQQQQ